jgi:hypothetical protein
MKELEALWTELKDLTADGAPSMTGEKTGFSVGEKLTKKIQNFIWNFTATFTNSHVAEKR